MKNNHFNVDVYMKYWPMKFSIKIDTDKLDWSFVYIEGT